jgi:hypothetical protein
MNNNNGNNKPYIDVRFEKYLYNKKRLQMKTSPFLRLEKIIMSREANTQTSLGRT